MRQYRNSHPTRIDLPGPTQTMWNRDQAGGFKWSSDARPPRIHKSDSEGFEKSAGMEPGVIEWNREYADRIGQKGKG